MERKQEVETMRAGTAGIERTNWGRKRNRWLMRVMANKIIQIIF